MVYLTLYDIMIRGIRLQQDCTDHCLLYLFYRLTITRGSATFFAMITDDPVVPILSGLGTVILFPQQIRMSMHILGAVLHRMLVLDPSYTASWHNHAPVAHGHVN